MKKVMDTVSAAILAVVTNDTLLCFIVALVLVGGIFWIGGR